jgi:hypothetical protein
MRIDHVILATTDLDRTAARLREEHGLAGVPGGRHVGLGTHNRIVPLGTGYLELLAVADPAEAATSTFGAWALATLAGGDERLMGWAVAVEDVAAHAARLGTAVDRLERAGLVVHHTGMAQAAATPATPFLIGRGAETPDPGAAAADHAVSPAGFAWIEVGGDASGLHAWLDRPATTLSVRVTAGAPVLRRAAIATADGRAIVL